VSGPIVVCKLWSLERKYRCETRLGRLRQGGPAGGVRVVHEVCAAPQYFLRRTGPSDSEVETVDVTTPLGCHALTRRPGHSVGKTDRLLVPILLREISLSQEVRTV
jgi:hypothetical protein